MEIAIGLLQNVKKEIKIAQLNVKAEKKRKKSNLLLFYLKLISVNSKKMQINFQ